MPYPRRTTRMVAPAAARGLGAGLAGAVLLIGLTACTTGAAPQESRSAVVSGSSAAGSGSPAAGSGSPAAGSAPGSAPGSRGAIHVSGAAAAVPPTVTQAITASVEQVNATAGGDPAEQRKVLLQTVDPAQRDTQQSCAQASTTVEFQPAWEGLRADPTGAEGAFLLPTLVRVHRGGRITSNDLTTLRVLVTAEASASGMTAWLPALCVR
ncbi:hypothetical protein [Nakamurella aerolata]|uniref:Lipoprotein n=1 Tax=Nakamurella aerolata TaxID=1656892 RepID=A0A849A4L2_9ACTN|nr:hypothetical protein [Nakamurella aerolata]NNG35519.1 hypothetical protein [Nakamurella aerolata]